MSVVIIVGINSDIGIELAKKFANEGWGVYGTHRSYPEELKSIHQIKSIKCDIESDGSRQQALNWLSLHCPIWNMVIVAIGTLEPIGNFFEADSMSWNNSIYVNAIGPLNLVRSLYKNRSINNQSSVFFFSGAGSNGTADSYSAYCLSKIMLTKACELLDSESKDTKFIILGPGIVNTKIHNHTILAGQKAGFNLVKVNNFLNSKNNLHIHMEDIFLCIKWCHGLNKKIIGGRNISVVNDLWRDGGFELIKKLNKDREFYKLRRFGNFWKKNETF